MKRCAEFKRIKKEIRELEFYDLKENCYICNNKNFMSERHHVVTVEDLARISIETGVKFNSDDIITVWLCPNCHYLVQKCLNKKTTQKTKKEKYYDYLFQNYIYYEMPEEQQIKLKEVIQDKYNKQWDIINQKIRYLKN